MRPPLLEAQQCLQIPAPWGHFWPFSEQILTYPQESVTGSDRRMAFPGTPRLIVTGNFPSKLLATVYPCGLSPPSLLREESTADTEAGGPDGGAKVGGRAAVHPQGTGNVPGGRGRWTPVPSARAAYSASCSKMCSVQKVDSDSALPPCEECM